MSIKPERTEDLVGKVTLSDGEHTLYMPTLGDIHELVMGRINSEDVGYYICAKSMRISLEEFKSLSMTDALIVMCKLNPALNAFSNYLTGSNGDTK